MTKNMLQAISKMLEKSKEPEVVCAKIMLDEIIKGMITPAIPVWTPPKDVNTLTLADTIDKPEKKQDVGMIIDNEKVVGFENLPMDGIVEVNGVKYNHTDLIGKTLKDIGKGKVKGVKA